MRIVLMATTLAIDIIGIRILSSVLKKEGYKVELLFIPNMEYELVRRGFHRGTFVAKYSEKALDQIANFCRDADLIGLSLISRDLDASIQVTAKLKQTVKAPVIWGGFHPTVCPAESLEFADIVCIGESETSLLELVRLMDAGKDYSSVPGLWVKDTNKRNPVGQLIHDLDTIPFSDYDCSTHYLLVADEIKPLTPDLLETYLRATYPAFKRVLPGMEERIKPGIADYHIIATRGCPHNCTFCGSPQLKKIYAGQRFVRRRSVDNIISELKSINKEFRFFTDVHFCDDCFMLASDDYIKDFSKKYKEELNLPFYCLTSPATITETKLQYLVEAGLSFLSVGIQTGSKRTLEMYRRVNANKGIGKALKLINRHKDRVFPYYDFLIDNPYETDEDLLETIKLIKRMRRPYKIRIYSLVPFPGTELYMKQKESKLLEGDIKEVYRKDFAERSEQIRYFNLLIDLSRYQIPEGIFNFLTYDFVVKLLSKSILKNVVKVPYKLISFRQHINEKRRLRQGDLLG